MGKTSKKIKELAEGTAKRYVAWITSVGDDQLSRAADIFDNVSEEEIDILRYPTPDDQNHAAKIEMRIRGKVFASWYEGRLLEPSGFTEHEVEA